MTREEVIDRLTYLMSDLNEFCNEQKHMSDDDRKEMESLDMAIKALKQKPCEDAVSRREVLDELRTCFDTHSIYDENNGENYIIYEDAVDMMEKLQPVTPTRKVGKWIRHYCDNGDLHHITCSNCHTWHENFSEYRYCPYCGADMRGGEDGSN